MIFTWKLVVPDCDLEIRRISVRMEAKLKNNINLTFIESYMQLACTFDLFSLSTLDGIENKI